MAITPPSSTVAGPIGAVQYAGHSGEGPLNQTGSANLIWDEDQTRLTLGPFFPEIVGVDAIFNDPDHSQGATLTVAGGRGLIKYAQLTSTFSGQPSNGNQIAAGGKTYTFQTVLTNADGNVLIGATLTNTLANLAAAINLDPAVSGTSYAASTTSNPAVYASSWNATDITVKASPQSEESHAGNNWTVDALTSPLTTPGATNLQDGRNPAAGGFVSLGHGYESGAAGDATLSGGDMTTNLAAEGNGGSVHIVGTNGVSTSGTGDYDGGGVTITLGLPAAAGAPGQLIITNLPTADPGISGAIWNSAGTLKVSP